MSPILALRENPKDREIRRDVSILGDRALYQ